jgi:hypothetical protein
MWFPTDGYGRNYLSIPQKAFGNLVSEISPDFTRWLKQKNKGFGVYLRLLIRIAATATTTMMTTAAMATYKVVSAPPFGGVTGVGDAVGTPLVDGTVGVIGSPEGSGAPLSPTSVDGI